jgi:hypothetical protein
MPNRIFNSMSDQQRQPKAATGDEPKAQLDSSDVQRRRADVVAVLAETLVDVRLKQQRELRAGTRR